MKKRTVTITSIIALVLILSVGTASAAIKTVTIRVKGMTCDGCATTLEQVLKSTEGVKDASVSYEKGTAVIKYDDQKTTVAKLRQVINFTGFTCEMK